MKSSVAIRGVRYAFDDIGSGPLVLFGHGMLFDRRMFRAQAEALCARCRCVLLDWPGHGESGFQASGWTADDLVTDIVELVHALGEQRAILVGLSQGGAVFTRVALAHPELVRALVIMDATPSAVPPSARDWLKGASAAIASGDAASKDAVLREALARMFSPATCHDRPELAGEARALFESHDRTGLSLALQVPLSYTSIVERLGELRVPTLVAWGADDASSPPALARAYLENIPGAQGVTFPDAGHSPPLEQPHAVTAALERFLDSLDATPGEITALETRRCQALMAGDVEALAGLLAPELTHVHANGEVDDRDSYLHKVRERLRFPSVKRHSLDVRVHGDVAIAVGRLEQAVEVVATGQRLPMRLVTTQAWVRCDRGWLLSSFHATPEIQP
jgi:pimeloyl-ACP methyl ester carboxylesterase/ketosteroid isomerase-like protein